MKTKRQQSSEAQILDATTAAATQEIHREFPHLVSDLKTNNNTSSNYWSREVLLMGGLSILTWIAAWTFMDKSASLATISALAFSLAFVVNHPHFLSSYIILYFDLKNDIASRFRYIWAAVIVPVVLGGFLYYSLINDRSDLLGQAVNAMYFLVGWHYVKQVFGCIVVTSAQRKIFYKAWERKIMLFNLFSLWAMSCLQSHVGLKNFDFYGIAHQGFNLPEVLLPLTYWLVGISSIAMVSMHLRKYVEEGVVPSPPAVAALVSLYIWYIPSFSHPAYAYLIPFFHSLQYLVFVGVLKSNEVRSQNQNFSGKEWRKRWLLKFGGFVMAAYVLGALCFEFIPKFLDGQGLVHSGGQMGYAPILASFILFINIHHYFIDNVIWRADNARVKKYLMQK